MIWPGCFRCHDGKHKADDGRTVKANDCNACHTILAQGSGDELLQLSPAGQKFKHPGGDYDLSCYGLPTADCNRIEPIMRFGRICRDPASCFQSAWQSGNPWRWTAGVDVPPDVALPAGRLSAARFA